MSAAGLPSHDDRLARRDSILAAVARASEILSEAQPWTSVVDEALRFLGEATSVSRVYIFRVDSIDGSEFVSQCYEWCNVGIAPQIDNPDLQNVPLEAAGFTRWATLLKVGDPVFGDIGDFPESERPLLEMQDIKSILIQPIFDGKKWWGFMGFDACASIQSWARVEVDTLRIAALVLGSAIHRQTRDAHLHEIQKMEALARMASGVAHDFNNVLMVVACSIELLKSELELAGMGVTAQGEQISMMEQALDRASTLTRRLLEFSKRRSNTPQIVSPLHLLNKEEPLLRQALGNRARLRISPGGHGAVSPIRIDPTAFAQLILNLAVNARDAMPQGGDLTFEVSTISAEEPLALYDRVPEGQWTLVRATDTGTGMTDEVMEHAFEPFFTTKPPEQGTGLGLPTIRSIVNSAGGHIKVSSAIGRGTEFRIYFPAVISETPVESH
ncbi:MAG: ATP-binding protein [Phycisphaerales bacterium]